MPKNKGSPSSSLRRETTAISSPAMRIALISWESLHSICVGGVGVHVTELAAALERKGHEVHVFTRMAQGQQHYERIDGVHYHRSQFPLNPNFIEEINDMCRSFVHDVFRTEDYMGKVGKKARDENRVGEAEFDQGFHRPWREKTLEQKKPPN